MDRYAKLGHGLPPVHRLGLATRGNTRPTSDDLWLALESGINYWNWCGHEDGMSQAVRELGRRRSEVVVATQIVLPQWSGDAMRRGIEETLAALKTEWLDIVTLYYVESQCEWHQIVSKDGALEALQEAKQVGTVRSIGLTTHQRRLAAEWAETELLDMLMVRYNAAHRGAETEVFPITDRKKLPVVCFTCLRWGALMAPTGDEPAGFEIPSAPSWYRFVLSNDSVSVALMAPNNRTELLNNLSLLEDWRKLSASEREMMIAHGDRVREAAGPFP